MIIASINYAKGKEKVKKAKKREESSDKSPIEELGSSEAKESLGKEQLHRKVGHTGCDLYALIDHDLARKLRLPVVDRSERLLGSFSDAIGAIKATGVVVFNLELCGYDKKIFAYTHRRGGVDLRLKGEEEPDRVREIRATYLLPGAPFITLYKRAQQHIKGYEVRAISLADI
ncbi:hypothetical protein CKAH01_16925 [Colletotrichum kahawae]|uniref:Uncharacterized protein n=1 Tax=Colletotrichum kahawae TaxID=34407 RepID=A0AAE0D4S3_COLKA|nr:hypothetical protein CKAH01_16925 [Colletotrichum kahawae]